MSVVLRNGDYGGKESGILYTKGAAEMIVGRSSSYTDSSGQEMKLTDDVREDILAAIETMAKNALRVICMAHRTYKKVSTAPLRYRFVHSHAAASDCV